MSAQLIRVPRFRTTSTTIAAMQDLCREMASTYEATGEMENELHGQEEYEAEAEIQGYRAAIYDIRHRMSQILGDNN